jgi:hypothetical protein
MSAMRHLLRHYEKILLALGVLVFLAAGALGAMRLRQLDEIAARNPAAGIEPARYEYEKAVVPEITTVAWSEPPTQSRGGNWLYDVFTPPVIYYNPSSREFTLTPPAPTEQVAAAPTDQAFDIVLVNVRREPYRIQLVGSFAGASKDDSSVAMFEIVDTDETVVGGPGKRFELQGFTVKSFEIRRVTSQAGGGMMVIENIPVATIIDDRTGREEVLIQGERKMMPRLQGVFRINVYPGETKTVYEGGQIEANGYVYQIAQLSLMPVQAVVSRRSREALGTMETRTLRPETPDAETSPARASRIVPAPE